jgi:hypothetical protein
VLFEERPSCLQVLSQSLHFGTRLDVLAAHLLHERAEFAHLVLQFVNGGVIL